MSETSDAIDTTARNTGDGRGPRIVSGIAFDVPAGRPRRSTSGAIGGSAVSTGPGASAWTSPDGTAPSSGALVVAGAFSVDASWLELSFIDVARMFSRAS